MTWRVRWQVECETCGKIRVCPDNRTAPKDWLTCWWLYGEHHICNVCKGDSMPDWWPVDAENPSVGNLSTIETTPAPV